jgi:hypothetical protein
MENQNIIISKILNTAPFQLPPVVYAGGCYQLSISYLGQPLHTTAVFLEQVLQSYLDHVVMANYQHGGRQREPLSDLPVKLGAAIYQLSENH